MDESTVAHEIGLLQREIARLGTRDAATGTASVTFGVLYDATVDIFEALAGTLKAAKKRGVIAFDAPLLLKGTHDKVVITLLKEA